jgi:hypothetical protein
MGWNTAAKEATMIRNVLVAAVAAAQRLAAWIRTDYPQAAPDRGHCYLIALCPAREVPR